MTPITADLLRAIAPKFSGANGRAQADIIDAIAGDFSSILGEYQIDTPLRVAHFLAQIVHESAGLRTTEEFASGAAYEGRVSLGNTVAGDGKRYKGRGVLQLTGRANYRKYGAVLGLDLEGQPHIAAEPLVSLRIACVYWADRKINPLCDADDLEGVTRKVNGGLNGLADRRQYLAKAKAALAQASEPVALVAEEKLVIPAADGEKPGLTARIGAALDTSEHNYSILNRLSEQGSRVAGALKAGKSWFYRLIFGGVGGGTAASQLVDTSKETGPVSLVMGWVEAHPFLFVGICLTVTALVVYFCVLKRSEKFLVTAFKDGRYSPRGSP